MRYLSYVSRVLIYTGIYRLPERLTNKLESEEDCRAIDYKGLGAAYKDEDDEKEYNVEDDDNNDVEEDDAAVDSLEGMKEKVPGNYKQQ